MPRGEIYLSNLPPEYATETGDFLHRLNDYVHDEHVECEKVF